MAAAAIFAVAAVFVLLLFLPGKTVLCLEDGDTGQVYAEYAVEDGDSFSITFIHSVNKSPVTEGYVINGEDIYLETCLYSAFGAGVATEVEEGQSLSYTEDGEMLLSGIHRKMEHLSYIVGTVSDHVLHLGDQEISLRELCGRNSTVHFLIEKKRPWTYLLP